MTRFGLQSLKYVLRNIIRSWTVCKSIQARRTLTSKIQFENNFASLHWNFVDLFRPCLVNNPLMSHFSWLQILPICQGKVLFSPTESHVREKFDFEMSKKEFLCFRFQSTSEATRTLATFVSNRHAFSLPDVYFCHLFSQVCLLIYLGKLFIEQNARLFE